MRLIDVKAHKHKLYPSEGIIPGPFYDRRLLLGFVGRQHRGRLFVYCRYCRTWHHWDYPPRDPWGMAWELQERPSVCWHPAEDAQRSIYILVADIWYESACDVFTATRHRRADEWPVERGDPPREVITEPDWLDEVAAAISLGRDPHIVERHYKEWERTWKWAGHYSQSRGY